MFWNRIPHCDTLFKKFLSPSYPEKSRPTMTRPDMYVISAFEGKSINIDQIQYLEPDILKATKEAFDIYRKAYYTDFQHYVQFQTLNLDVIDAIDKYFEEPEVRELIKRSKPTDPNNLYVAHVIEFGLALGDLFVETGKFKWLYSNPEFHSIVVNPDTGNAITVFDWAVKKFSSYGIDDGFKKKFLKALEIVERDIKQIG
jgi:hypothetical protein